MSGVRTIRRIRITAAMLLSVGIVSHAANICRGNPILNSLEVYYQFDGTGADSSGNARDVGLFGGVGFGSGLYGQALSLSGDATMYASRPTDDSVLNFGANDFTIQAWVNFNDTSSEQTILEKFDNQAGPGWTLTKLTSNQIQFYGSGAFGGVNTNPLTISTDEWHQIVVRRSGNALRILFDGSLEADVTIGGSISPTTMPLLIGKRNEFDGRDFATDGSLDEVAIWTRALSDAEIAGLYNGGSGTLLAAVPEPSSLALLATGAFGFMGYGWRRKRKLAA